MPYSVCFSREGAITPISLITPQFIRANPSYFRVGDAIGLSERNFRSLYRFLEKDNENLQEAFNTRTYLPITDIQSEKVYTTHFISVTLVMSGDEKDNVVKPMKNEEYEHFKQTMTTCISTMLQKLKEGAEESSGSSNMLEQLASAKQGAQQIRRHVQDRNLAELREIGKNTKENTEEFRKKANEAIKGAIEEAEKIIPKDYELNTFEQIQNTFMHPENKDLKGQILAAIIADGVTKEVFSSISLSTIARVGVGLAVGVGTGEAAGVATQKFEAFVSQFDPVKQLKERVAEYATNAYESVKGALSGSNFEPELEGEGESLMIAFDVKIDSTLYSCSIGVPITDLSSLYIHRRRKKSIFGLLQIRISQ